MDYLQCIFVRKKTPKIIKDEIKPTVMKEVKDPPIHEECSWAGCMLDFNKNRQPVQMAKIGQNNYAFCSDYCYKTWLGAGYFI